MLKFLAYPILSLISLLSGSGLENYLLTSLFKVQKKLHGDENLRKVIERRKPLKVAFCNWLLKRRNRRHQNKASAIMTQELDIVNFLRKQFVLGLTQKLLFTSHEFYLLKN